MLLIVKISVLMFINLNVVLYCPPLFFHSPSYAWYIRKISFFCEYAWEGSRTNTGILVNRLDKHQNQLHDPTATASVHYSPIVLVLLKLLIAVLVMNIDH